MRKINYAYELSKVSYFLIFFDAQIKIALFLSFETNYASQQVYKTRKNKSYSFQSRHNCLFSKTIAVFAALCHAFNQDLVNVARAKFHSNIRSYFNTQTGQQYSLFRN
jgi:hypothetical protein